MKQGRPVVESPETQIRLGMKNLDNNKCKHYFFILILFKIQEDC